MVDKLYTVSLTSGFYYLVKIAADITNTPLEVVLVDKELMEKPEFKTKRGHLQFPMLETADGKIIGESMAIAQFILRRAGESMLYGNNAMEEA